MALQESPLLNEVLANVTRLYHGTSRQEQAAANRWLMQFQRENSAWEVAVSVLSFVQGLDEKRPELYLFAAQTLRKKIQRDLASLALDFRWKLRDALLLYAAQYAHANAQVLTQICLSISALALRLSQWHDPLKDIFESLSAESLHGALVKLLEVLPEDCLEEGPSTFRRMEYMKELLAKTPQVLVFLQQRLIQGGGDIGSQRGVLDCLLGWVRLGGMSELPQDSLPEHPLIAYSLDSLANPGLADVAASVVSELLQRHAVMAPAVLRLVPHFQATVLPRYVQQEEEEGVSAIVEVLTELGASAPQLIAQGIPDAMALCTTLIGSITLPETCGWDPYTLPTTSLSFWSNEALVSRITSEQQQSPFIPVYRQLLGALLISVRSDSEPDEKDGLVHLEEDLINFRSECEDALLAVCQVLGPQQYLQQVLEGVQAWSTGQQPARWEEIEVRMYLCEAIADETQKLLKKDQLPKITPLFQFIAGLPTNQPLNQQKGGPLVHNAAARVTSAFAKWLYSHPDAGSALLTFLVGALQSPVSAGASARALKHVCEEVTAVTSETSSLEGLLHIGENLPSFRLTAEQEEDVLSAVGAVLSEQPADRVAQGLQRLLRPNRLALEALIERPGPISSCPVVELHAYVQAINRLGALFRHVRSFPEGSDDPLAAILYSEWPLLERLLASPHAAEDSITGAVCQTLQDAVRATGVKFGALLSPFLLAMTRGFASAHPHPAYLRAASAASEELSSEPSIGPISLEALRVFSAAPAVASIRAVEDADREPEITEAYLHFVITFLRSSRRDVVSEALGQVQVALSIGAGCACASHRGVSASALSLVAAVMEAALPSSDETSAAVVPLVNLVVQSGRIIVHGLVQALLGISPMTKIHKIASIFQQLAVLVIQHSGQPPEAGLALLQHWLASVLQALPTGCLRPDEAQAVPQIWGDAFVAAAADVSQHGANERGRAGGGGYLGGDGGRRIKRVIRDFVDGHRV